MYQIANVDQNNKASFNDIYRLFRLGQLYNKYIDNKDYDRANRSDLLSNMNYARIKCNKNDLARIEKLTDLVDTR